MLRRSVAMRSATSIRLARVLVRNNVNADCTVAIRGSVEPSVDPIPWSALLSIGNDTSLAAIVELMREPKPAHPPRILVSGCLLGLPITFRGKPSGVSRKRRPDAPITGPAAPLHWLLDVLWLRLGLVECVPFCPEMQWLRLTAPRHPVRLVRRALPTVRVSTAASSYADAIEQEPSHDAVVIDATTGRELWQYTENRPISIARQAQNRTLPAELVNSAHKLPPVSEDTRVNITEWLSGVDGLVVKAKSPSCGLGDARLYDPWTVGQGASPTGRHQRAMQPFARVDGFFVKAVKDGLATLPLDYPSFPIASEATLCGKHLSGEARPPTAALIDFLESASAHCHWRTSRSQH